MTFHRPGDSGAGMSDPTQGFSPLVDEEDDFDQSSAGRQVSQESAYDQEIVFDGGDLQNKKNSLNTKVDPFTEELAIIDRNGISVELLRELALFRRDRGVAEECWARTKPDALFMSRPDASEEYGYFRIVSLNWWYKRLAFSMLHMVLWFGDVFAGISFCVLLWDDKFRGLLLLKWTFLVAFTFSETIAMGYVLYHVRNHIWHLRRQPGYRDAIFEVPFLDLLKLYVSLLAIELGEVEQLVRDIVIKLHPLKNVQKFAALKTRETRCFLIGYPSEDMFYCENNYTVMHKAPRTFSRGVRIAMQVALIRSRVVGESATVGVWLSLPSVIALLFNLAVFFATLRSRQRYWEWLNSQHEECGESSSDENDYKRLDRLKSHVFPDRAWRTNLRETACCYVLIFLWIILAAAMVLLVEFEMLGSALTGDWEMVPTSGDCAHIGAVVANAFEARGLVASLNSSVFADVMMSLDFGHHPNPCKGFDRSDFITRFAPL